MVRLLLVLTTLGAVLAGAGSAAAQQTGAGCAEEFGRLRQDVDTRFTEARAAGDRKASQPELCQVLRRASDSLTRFSKYIEENQAWCQFPEQLLTQVKGALGNAQKQRNQICAARPVAAQPPPSGKGIGSLGSPTGLGGGTTDAPAANPSTQGAGVFSTIGGASR